MQPLNNKLIKQAIEMKCWNPTPLVQRIPRTQDGCSAGGYFGERSWRLPHLATMLPTGMRYWRSVHLHHCTIHRACLRGAGTRQTLGVSLHIDDHFYCSQGACRARTHHWCSRRLIGIRWIASPHSHLWKPILNNSGISMLRITITQSLPSRW